MIKLIIFQILLLLLIVFIFSVSSFRAIKRILNRNKWREEYEPKERPEERS